MRQVDAVDVPEAVLRKLLDPADPAVRLRVLTDLLDRPQSDPQVVDARQRLPAHPWIKATLAAHHGDGTWGRGFYHKYDGTSWVLLHLSEVGAPMDRPEIRAGVDRLVRTARPVSQMKGARAEPFHGLEDGVYWTHPIVCLTAHMALVLIRAGLSDHPVTRSALNVCHHRFEAGRGFGCFVMDPSLMPACIMTVPKVLKAVLALPPEGRTPRDRKLIEDMAAVLEAVGLYRYVPLHGKEWRTRTRDLTPTERAAEKRRWIAEGKLEPRIEKEGWLRFSFPHNYNSDLLEVLLLLSEAGARRTPAIEAGLARLVERRRPDGTWSQHTAVRGKMHANLEPRRQWSAWITYRALLTLKRFEALQLPKNANDLA